MLSKCQDIPIGIQNILIGNNEKFVPKIFNKKKFVLHYENLHLYLRLGFKLKKNILRIRIKSIRMAEM